jgi:hypothetical protein
VANPSGSTAEKPGSSCRDGIDNDCDGLFDCKDEADCAADGCCNPVPEDTTTRCTDGIDNDCDGIQDAAETSCAKLICRATGTENLNCGDNVDNDCDGRVDCDDQNCIGTKLCECIADETTATECSNGLDDDCDGLTDCDDRTCATTYRGCRIVIASPPIISLSP